MSRTLARVLRAWHCRPSDLEALVVASRGAWTRTERQRLQRQLQRTARRVRVISDAEAAHLGALGGGAGVLILAGTGSIAIGRNDAGAWGRAGGLGPLVGDEGSAFWIGREWLRATAAAARLRRIVGEPAPVARIAAQAPRVLSRARRGDRRARRIVHAAQRHLAWMVRDVTSQLALSPPVPVSWAGSLLTLSPWFRSGIARELARAGVRATWVAPKASPDRAAARLAEALGRASRSSHAIPRRRQGRDGNDESPRTPGRRSDP